MMVYLPGFVFLLRRVCRGVVFLHELIAQDKLVSALDCAPAGLSFRRAFPVANEKSNRLPGVRLIIRSVDTCCGHSEGECNGMRFYTGEEYMARTKMYRPNETELSTQHFEK